MSDALREQLLTMARYNVWATQRLFEHVDALPEDDYRRDAGLFFRSVHGTLNHLWVGEHLLWFRRIHEGVSMQIALDAQPLADRAELRQHLQDGAGRWEPFIRGLAPERLTGMLDYTTTKGVAMSLPLAATLAHVFNHGTHHRGQVSAAITAMGHACPEMDLVWMLQEESRR